MNGNTFVQENPISPVFSIRHFLSVWFLYVYIHKQSIFGSRVYTTIAGTIKYVYVLRILRIICNLLVSYTQITLDLHKKYIS
jgi:hypothetical protein